MKYQTPKGLNVWSDSTVRRILKNEKYKGDVLQGKTYTTDPITHKRVVNMGEENMYYIKEHHQAIIEPELFDKVQQKKENEKVIIVENIHLVAEFIVDFVEQF